jgi:hypothetical protein
MSRKFIFLKILFCICLGIFILGTPLYKRVPPKENIIVKFVAIIWVISNDFVFCLIYFSFVISELYKIQYLVHKEKENIGFIMLMINIVYDKKKNLALVRLYQK